MVAIGVVAPFLAALVLSLFRTNLANAAGALALVATIVAVASAGSRAAGAAATVSSSAFFDFFLTRPYEAFSITSRNDIETTVALLVVGVAVTEIAVRARERFAVASEEGNHLATIREASELTASGAEANVVASTVADQLCEVLSLRSCRFSRGPGQGSLPRLGRNGEIELDDVRYPVAERGLPEGLVQLDVSHRGHAVGRFLLEPTPGTALTIEARVTAITLADQVGAAFDEAPAST